MLITALPEHEDKLNKLIREGDYPYLGFDPFLVKNPIEIQDTDEEIIQKISIDDDDNILGFFQAFVNRSTRCITGTYFVKFKYKYKEYINEACDCELHKLAYNDFRKFVDDLYNNPLFTRMVIKAVANNPANKVYAEFAQKYNGTIVTIPDKFLLQDGKYYDCIEYWFSTLSDKERNKPIKYMNDANKFVFDISEASKKYKKEIESDFRK